MNASTQVITEVEPHSCEHLPIRKRCKPCRSKRDSEYRAANLERLVEQERRRSCMKRCEKYGTDFEVEWPLYLARAIVRKPRTKKTP